MPKIQYNEEASIFISNRLDEDNTYSNAPVIFEEIINKDERAGFILDNMRPLIPRCMIIKVPNLKDLAFIYFIRTVENAKFIDVITIEYI